MSKTFIIAELSANHGGNLTTALETIKAAKKAGADAIKIQTYTAETITLNCERDDFVIKGGTLWDGRKLYDLYQEAYTPWEWHQEIFDTAHKEGLICFSSPFDKTAVDFLETLNCPIYKVASFEISDIPLIAYIASKGKPMILSTGIASFDDIALAIETCRKEGNKDITLLKCTSSYPAPIEEANLSLMKSFEKDFDVKVGLSDHTLGITVPIVSVVLGATVIEKHFILDRNMGGPDAAFSLNPDEFASMVRSVREAEKSVGKADYTLTQSQIKGKQFARSLYVSKDISKGEVYSDENIKSVRPGYGLHPKFYQDIIGKTAQKDWIKGDRLDFPL